LTFYIVAVQKVSTFAAMKAVGASTAQIVALLVIQALIVFAIAAVGTAIGLASVSALLTSTPISLVIRAGPTVALVGVMAIASIVACLPAVLRLARTQPAEAFRG
jgi:putative ABC transport system permease protein